MLGFCSKGSLNLDRIMNKDPEGKGIGNSSDLSWLGKVITGTRGRGFTLVMICRNERMLDPPAPVTAVQKQRGQSGRAEGRQSKTYTHTHTPDSSI